MVSQKRLKEVLDYDPDTGLFTWKVWRRGRANVGTAAGSPDPRGYVIMCIDNHRYNGHRLAWLYMTGEWPRDQIDHIDGNKTNNRFGNLREANVIQQQGNTRKRAGRSCQYKGVSFHKRSGKWHARLGQKWLGEFDKPEAAHAAYRKAADAHFGEFARFE